MDVRASGRAGLLLPRRALLAQTASLHADLAAALGRSRELVKRSYELCLWAYPRIQPIGGGSSDYDAALISAAMTDAPLCAECIARKTGVPASRVGTVLAVVGEHLKITRRMETCAACLGLKRVFRLADGTKRGTRDSILSFLEQHPGEAFCADCIATTLFDGKKNIDVAMRHLEGNGVRRRHARCAACEKLRLVAGVSQHFYPSN